MEVPRGPPPGTLRGDTVTRLATSPWGRAGRLCRCSAALCSVTLVITGLAAPSPRPRPLVEARTKTLSAGLLSPGWTKAVDAPLPTQLVGFDWEGRRPGTVQVRARHQGRWGAWAALEGVPIEGPDRGSREYRGRTAAGPVWIGRGVRDLQVKVAGGAVRGLRMHTIRSKTGSARSTVPRAFAAPPQPGMLTRAQWGADESWRRYASGCNGSPDMGSVRFSVVHHTANPNGYGRDEAAALVRGVYWFHTHVNRWCDIGYNFLVDRYGQVYEGRYGGIARPVVGAHTAGFNSESTGVAVLGSFESSPIPGDAYGALRRLLAWKLTAHGLEADSKTSTTAREGSDLHPSGRRVEVSTIAGHRDLDRTECPGDAAYGQLGRLRADVQRDIEPSRGGLGAVLAPVQDLLDSLLSGPPKK